MHKKPVTVQSVDRALEIIDILEDEPQGLGVTPLSKKMGVSKSTIYRLLSSLLNKEYVRQNEETQKYHLGLRLMQLGQTVTNQIDIRQVAAPVMERLVQDTGETVHLVVQDGNEIVYIDKIESQATIRMFSNIGKRAPMHCTGVGKAILSNLSDEEIDNIIKENGLEKFTNNTITDPQKLKEHLKEILMLGYSIDDEEHEMGIKCAASPIFNFKGEVIAGISVAGPIMRINDNKIQHMAKEVLKASKEISESLGAL